MDGEFKMNIVYGCDETYIPILYVSVSSLFESNSRYQINVYIIAENISIKSKEKINSLCDKKNKIIWLPLINIEDETGGNVKFDRGSSAQFARLLIGRYLPKDIDKVLYLDCDTMIVSSLEELWNIDLSKCTFAACLDAFSPLYSKKIGLSRNATLINSGVLMINVARWRFNNYESYAIDILREKNGEMPQGDQGLLDILCQNDLIILKPRFNCVTGYFEFSYRDWLRYRKPSKRYEATYTEKVISSDLVNPVIIHFTSSFLQNRPWYNSSIHPYKDKWNSILQNSSMRMNTNQKENQLKKIYKFLPHQISILIFGVLQAYIRPVFSK